MEAKCDLSAPSYEGLSTVSILHDLGNSSFLEEISGCHIKILDCPGWTDFCTLWLSPAKFTLSHDPIFLQKNNIAEWTSGNTNRASRTFFFVQHDRTGFFGPVQGPFRTCLSAVWALTLKTGKRQEKERLVRKIHIGDK